MRVFAVQSIALEGQRLQGIFTTKEEAEEIMQGLKLILKGQFGHVWIAVYELNILGAIKASYSDGVNDSLKEINDYCAKNPDSGITS